MSIMKNSVGIGFRRDFAEEFLESDVLKPDFIELAPENWMQMGGYWKRILRQAAEKYPVVCHGLSLSIGSPDPLDFDFLKKIKQFLDEYGISLYSEHLSYSKCDNAHLYDLLPIPFREDAIKHISERLRQVQDFLERPVALENVSYYTSVAAEMDEATFLTSILEESGCNLLLDVNNVYVNAFNHRYDAKAFLEGIPLGKVAYIHMAGHEQVEPDLIIDTHGQPIIDPVYELFRWTAERVKPVPVLLERDFNIPGLPELQGELDTLRQMCPQTWKNDTYAH